MDKYYDGVPKAITMSNYRNIILWLVDNVLNAKAFISVDVLETIRGKNPTRKIGSRINDNNTEVEKAEKADREIETYSKKENLYWLPHEDEFKRLLGVDSDVKLIDSDMILDIPESNLLGRKIKPVLQKIKSIPDYQDEMDKIAVDIYNQIFIDGMEKVLYKEISSMMQDKAMMEIAINGFGGEIGYERIDDKTVHVILQYRGSAINETIPVLSEGDYRCDIGEEDYFERSWFCDLIKKSGRVFDYAITKSGLEIRKIDTSKKIIQSVPNYSYYEEVYGNDFFSRLYEDSLLGETYLKLYMEKEHDEAGKQQSDIRKGNQLLNIFEVILMDMVILSSNLYFFYYPETLVNIAEKKDQEMPYIKKLSFQEILRSDFMRLTVLDIMFQGYINTFENFRFRLEDEVKKDIGIRLNIKTERQRNTEKKNDSDFRIDSRNTLSAVIDKLEWQILPLVRVLLEKKLTICDLSSREEQYKEIETYLIKNRNCINKRYIDVLRDLDNAYYKSRRYTGIDYFIGQSKVNQSGKYWGGVKKRFHYYMGEIDADTENMDGLSEDARTEQEKAEGMEKVIRDLLSVIREHIENYSGFHLKEASKKRLLQYVDCFEENVCQELYNVTDEKQWFWLESSFMDKYELLLWGYKNKMYTTLNYFIYILLRKVNFKQKGKEYGFDEIIWYVRGKYIEGLLNLSDIRGKIENPTLKFRPIEKFSERDIQIVTEMYAFMEDCSELIEEKLLSFMQEHENILFND